VAGNVIGIFLDEGPEITVNIGTVALREQEVGECSQSSDAKRGTIYGKVG
jgi:hypothetical protein